MMRNNQKKLKELVREVMDQMHKRKYGKKISGRYRSSFHLIMSISHDMEEDGFPERLIEAFLSSPVNIWRDMPCLLWDRLLKPWFRTKRVSRDFLKIFRILPEAFITPPRFRANSADISLPVGTLMRTLSRLEGSVSQHQSSRISLPRGSASFFKECDRMSEEPRLKGRHIVFPAMFRLLYCCGLRCKEVRTLAWKDVHLNLMTSNTVASYRASLNIRIGFLEDVKGGPRERVDYL
ncbi:hypothetical protein ADH76_10260 [Enterocloster clostridioformis]|uniref:hypothetical protein n=2 Tax=Enterocloster clostridioformis TaxID=1531 RepID=UPI00080CBAD5|nr:hypothetical protein [Enterocloster clostridioformis]ANU48467.1 hypothetical protein A4V08_24340 [Lachnoclostridium sp. YL32]NDO29272.1 hypothetical protein [Enterocloster clostridioformis]OXE68830.1 hypothetical protein ADH76_10260 [Enterocloster clostridioformis]QQR02644.1 hypothetical protein I5Q83_10445 [Enterocloster clostridioformis]